MGKRKVQEINASSMADIAFLLLIFFLVTTTMAVDKGLSRQLPPPPDPNQKIEEQQEKFNKRNVFVVLVNSYNQLLVQGEQMDVRNLRKKAKEFILNENDDANLPEKLPVQANFGEGDETILTTSKHIISLQNDRGTEYQKYVEVQNELVAAYNEVRNEYSIHKFGKKYDDLNEEQQKGVQKVYPQKISEAEPKNYAAKKNK
jgi:biopolymer transport protein ExbD